VAAWGSDGVRFSVSLIRLVSGIVSCLWFGCVISWFKFWIGFEKLDHYYLVKCYVVLCSDCQYSWNLVFLKLNFFPNLTGGSVIIIIIAAVAGVLVLGVVLYCCCRGSDAKGSAADGDGQQEEVRRIHYDSSGVLWVMKKGKRKRWGIW
jgi:hypothetical protein